MIVVVLSSTTSVSAVIEVVCAVECLIALLLRLLAVRVQQ
jgi:hypothetical protein